MKKLKKLILKEQLSIDELKMIVGKSGRTLSCTALDYGSGVVAETHNSSEEWVLAWTKVWTGMGFDVKCYYDDTPYG